MTVLWSVIRLLDVVSGLLYGAEELVLVHLVSAFLPGVPEGLQHGADLFARGDAQLAEVVATDGETGHCPAAHLCQKLLLTLVLQKLTHLVLYIHLPALKAET